MSNIAREIFLHYASSAVDRVILGMRKRYTPVKERGFILNGITYEIAPPEIKEDSFEIDLISDIPLSFFKRVKKEISKFNF
ncbi:MAG: hypothetical protein HZA07_07275 [Nitrospirae bacterium]|nr:hypothetical protein [Nitrospirota bacterium]